MLTVKSNHDAFDTRLRADLGTSLPFAVARGLTWTLKDVQRNYPKWARRAFDNPVNWTLRAMFVKPVTKRRAGAAYFKDRARSGGKGVPAGKYLLPNIVGGSRVRTRWERRLIADGIMARNEYAMPTEYVMDRNGNVLQRYYAEIVAQLKFNSAGFGRMTGATARRRRERNVERIFVISDPNATAPRGIWQRDPEGGEITPLFIFTTRAPRYAAIFPWHDWARKTVKARAPINIRKSANAVVAKRSQSRLPTR